MEEARCSRSGDTADGYELVLMSWSKWRSLQAKVIGTRRTERWIKNMNQDLRDTSGV
jgi:hypothetical protein